MRHYIKKRDNVAKSRPGSNTDKHCNVMEQHGLVLHYDLPVPSFAQRHVSASIVISVPHTKPVNVSNFMSSLANAQVTYYQSYDFF